MNRTIGITYTAEVGGIGGEHTFGVVYDRQTQTYYEINSTGGNFGIGPPLAFSENFIFSNQGAEDLEGLAFGVEQSFLVGLNLSVGFLTGFGSGSGQLQFGPDAGVQINVTNTWVSAIDPFAVPPHIQLQFDQLEPLVDNFLDVGFVATNGFASQATFPDANDDTVLQHTFGFDGTLTIQENDFSGSVPWDSHITILDDVGNLTADYYDFSDADVWFDNHSVDIIDFTSYSEAAAESFFASVETSIYAGGHEADGIPGVFSYDNTTFGPQYDFLTGIYNVDVGIYDNDPTSFFTTVTLEDFDTGVDWGAGISFDTSGLDYAYDDWNMLWDDDLDVYYGYETYETNSFTDWAFGYWIEPVILDLDGDGVDITPLDGSQADFDIDGDGFDERTAWMGPGDGTLVIDLDINGNAGPDGIIDRIEEVSFSASLPGQDFTDLEALAELYDSNDDNVLDANDARWSEFRVWIDENQDGFDDRDENGVPLELHTLASLDIISIDLVSDNASFLLPDNSLIHGFSSFTYSDGTIGAVADAALAYDEIGFTVVERYFSSPTIGDIGGVEFTSEEGDSFYIFRVSDWYEPNGNWAYDETNNLEVGQTLSGTSNGVPFSLTLGGIVGGSFADTITVSDTDPLTGVHPENGSMI